MNAASSKRIHAAGLAILVAFLISGCASPEPGASLLKESVADDGRVMTAEYHHLANVNLPDKLIAPDARYSSVPWAVIERFPDVTTLFIAFVDNARVAEGCIAHVGTAVYETSTTVTIAALSGESDQPCDEEPAIGGGYFDLGEPIGDRTLLHAALSAPWDDLGNPLPTRVGPTYSTPTPEAVPSFDSDATCDNLLDPSTQSTLRESGLSLSGTFRDKILAAPDQQIHAFLRYGGIVCAWMSDGENSTIYAYGRIAADQADDEQASLVASGYTAVKTSADRAWQDQRDGYGTFAFGHGYWAYADILDDSSELAFLEEIIGNVPAF
ncbi:hypothetical protein QT381_07695 [Galbitalea sp. SE-J8]|uniref:hypothetical protein n=1 Tax=Galbitalea sp. SE-J8 TaxID=3054952 RepID=UPI00259CDCF1|nr:hypothetical protein [Galbitalea sp. SE-J8]MDM4762887.1 hypothetical protein [Galbitalea sp. SE-J8]